MIKEAEKITRNSSLNIDDVICKNNSVYLTATKNDEELVIVLPNKTALKKLSHFTERQSMNGVLRDNSPLSIGNQMVLRKCNWLLTDNNFNFVQCFTDKDYNPVCKDAKQSFLREVEHWGIANKKVGQIEVELLDGSIVKCLSSESTYFNQKVYLKDENSFVYLRKEDVTDLYPSELMYLFHRNVRGELNLQIIMNNNWFYEE